MFSSRHNEFWKKSYVGHSEPCVIIWAFILWLIVRIPLSEVWNYYINSQGQKKWGLLLKYLCLPLTEIIEISFLVFRFPPSSPLKPYPKKPTYQKDAIKFPEWNDPPPGTSQENIPVRPLVMVSVLLKEWVGWSGWSGAMVVAVAGGGSSSYQK